MSGMHLSRKGGWTSVRGVQCRNDASDRRIVLQRQRQQVSHGTVHQRRTQLDNPGGQSTCTVQIPGRWVVQMSFALLRCRSTPVTAKVNKFFICRIFFGVHEFTCEQLICESLWTDLINLWTVNLPKIRLKSWNRN